VLFFISLRQVLQIDKSFAASLHLSGLLGCSGFLVHSLVDFNLHIPANALFGKLQASTATSIGVDPVVTVAANASGGVMGKMISPQSIAIAAAAGNLVGKESDLFRFTFKHSLFMLLVICLIVTAQAYVFSWMIPHYQTPAANTVSLPADFSKKYIYLLLAVVVFVVVTLIVIKMARKKIVNSNKSS